MSTISNLISKYCYPITCVILLAITALSLTPIAHLPDAPGSDKTHHLIAYFALALPIALKGGPKWFFLLPIFVLWSGAIELIQPFVNRYGEWLDLAANSLGVILGSLAGVVFRRLENSRD